MASLRILVPEATTNYVTNPAMRYDTTGWTAIGATITRSLDYARFGIASLKIVTNGSALNEGAYFRVNALSGITDPITNSIYVRGSGKVRIRLIDQFRGSEFSSQPIALTNLRWTRIEVSGANIGSNDLRLYVESADRTAKAITFYACGAQMERKPYSTTYCDGDQQGCRWNIVAHSSLSTRDPYTRVGGRWVALAGNCRPDDNIYVTALGGLGMAPIHNNIQSYAQSPGSYFQNTKVGNRVVTMTFNVKHKDLRVIKDPSLSHLHELRQQLIDILKPDKTDGSEEFMLEYQDGPVPIYFTARYEAGLEGTWDVRNQWVNSFPVRFLAVSPFAFEDSQEVMQLDVQEAFPSTTSWGKSRTNQVWSAMNFGCSGPILRYRIGAKGQIYGVGSLLSTGNNNAAAVDPLIPLGNRAAWDGTKWSQIGGAAISAAGTIKDIVLDPSGRIYVTGNFTSIGGVAANRVAYFDGTNWNAMGTGLNAAGLSIVSGPDGNIYVGGSFTTAGGLSCSGIARWDGSSWHKVGQLGGVDVSATTVKVNWLVISLDGQTVYLGGNFTREFSGSALGLLRVAKLDVATNTLTQVGSGLNNEVYVLEMTKSGILYAGGVFTATQSPNVITVGHVGVFAGSDWAQLGAGKTTDVVTLSLDENENLYVGATMATGLSDVGLLSFWNGSSYVPLDIRPIGFGAGSTIPSILAADNGDVYISLANSQSSGISTVINPGSAEANMVVYISGPGTLRWLENQTTGKRLYLDLSILNGEEVFIDFARGKMYSALRGDLFYTIFPGSDFKSFTLLPGENKIAAFMINDVGAKMQIAFTPQHWSLDATARGAELF